jgi:hypothetical protein
MLPAHVGSVVMVAQEDSRGLQQLSAESCENNIVDTEQQVDGLRTSTENEEGSI